jgi:flagellar biosynthetic protein FlhB
MSEDRTQAPTRRRRDEARAHGIVPRGAELTAAAALLAATVLLGSFGDNLARAVLDLVRLPLTEPATWTMRDPSALASAVRGAVLHVVVPLAATLGGIVLCVVAVHQLQVGGLWAPGLLAPDPSRLTAGFTGGIDPSARLAQGIAGLAKVAAVVAVCAWAIHAKRAEFATMSRLGPEALALAASRLMLGLLRALAAGLLVVGAIDYALSWGRVEALLRQTPDEYRDDLKATDGDPAVRARRRRLVDSWRKDAADALPGATLCLLGSGGLAVLVAGGPPPGRVSVRQVARGSSASWLRRETSRLNLPTAEAPALAAFLSRRDAGPLPPTLAKQLADLWPRSERDQRREATTTGA